MGHLSSSHSYNLSCLGSPAGTALTGHLHSKKTPSSTLLDSWQNPSDTNQTNWMPSSFHF